VTPVDRFIALIRDETGNVVPPARRDFLAEVLERRSRAAGVPSTAAYVDGLEGGRLPGEWSALVPLVTIKESYFFRAPQQFAALARTLLPHLVRARAAERRLTVWSAACARGEEPGTLAILFAENALLRGWRWEIVGTDVDGEALETARRGLYGERAVAHVPPAQLARWFRPRGKLYELAPELRERIAYRPLNLARPPYDLGRGGRTFDLVLLRNVLIYFRRPLQRRVVAAVGQSLAADGALFLGASETLWQIQERLAAYDLGSCFCYRHRAEGEPEEPLKRLPAEREAEPAAVDGDGGGNAERAGVVDVPWLDPRGARRDEQLGTTPTSPEPVEGRAAADGAAETVPPPTSPEPVAGRGPQVEPPLPLAEALAAQRDDDASHLHAQPCGIQERLLGVARRLADGRLDEAHQDLEAVLEADPSEAAAHALDGFLHDLRGEADDAVQAYRAALYLDPALCQVRLLLADLMGRRGWQRRAHHEYREVLAALAAGRDRVLVPFEALPVPDREGAERRCRRALGRGE
jgi:chemotaxis protein methyltransferase CheR